MGGMIRFIGNKRLSSILVISSQPQYLSRARAWIEKLDARAEHSEKQFFTYRVQNRPAKELMTVLTSIFGTKGQMDSSVSPRFGQSSLSSGGGMGGGWAVSAAAAARRWAPSRPRVRRAARAAAVPPRAVRQGPAPPEAAASAPASAARPGRRAASPA